jgi:hypothetical protein
MVKCKVKIRRRKEKIIGFETTEECIHHALEVVAKELEKQEQGDLEITEEIIE